MKVFISSANQQKQGVKETNVVRNPRQSIDKIFNFAKLGKSKVTAVEGLSNKRR
jgi:hypothetical protein